MDEATVDPTDTSKSTAKVSQQVIAAMSEQEREEYEMAEMSVELVRMTTISADEAAVLRGCPTHNVMHRLGHVLADPGGSALTYNLSEQVLGIDEFISHNWSVKRWIKFLVLAYHFNRKKAAVLLVIFSLIGSALTVNGAIPVYKPKGTSEGGFLGSVLISPLYLFFFLYVEEWKWLASRSPLWERIKPHAQYTTFLDKTCIHQTDALLKRQGIKKLGAFLALSRRMAICYSDEYLRKLWTVYEIACFLVLHKIGDMTLIHVHWVLFFMVMLLYNYVISNFTYVLHFAELPPDLGLAALPMMIQAFFGFVALLMHRRMQRELRQARKRIEDFDVRGAMCLDEEDRPLVEGNINILLKTHDLVGFSSSQQEALDVFNSMVRQSMPAALKVLAGTKGLNYSLLALAVLPGMCHEIMDWSSIVIAKYGLFSFQVLVSLLEITGDAFIMKCAVFQTAFRIGQKCLHLKRWRGWLFIMITILITVGGYFPISYVQVMIIQFHIFEDIPEREQLDDQDIYRGEISVKWLLIFLAHRLICFAYLIFIFDGWKVGAGNSEVNARVFMVKPAQSSKSAHSTPGNNLAKHTEAHPATTSIDLSSSSEVAVENKMEPVPDLQVEEECELEEV